MKLIILFLYVLPIFSFTFMEKQKMCANCKYFKKIYFSVNHLGKCSLFPLEKTNRYLIDVPAIKTDADYTVLLQETLNICVAKKENYL